MSNYQNKKKYKKQKAKERARKAKQAKRSIATKAENRLEKEIEKLKKDSHPPVFKTEERDAIMARIISHSDRLIKLEKKAKKLK